MSFVTPPNSAGSAPANRSPVFATTRWTVVLAAGERDGALAMEALEQLCRAYWFPLYAYVRRRGYDAHAAQDLTQGFFARLLERNDLAGLTREGGRFRSFLLTALNHFLVNEHEKNRAQKRGGGLSTVSLDDATAEDRYQQVPSRSETPDGAFDRQWALAVMEQAMTRLAEEQSASGKTLDFEVLRPFLSREPDAGEYAELAARLGTVPATLAVRVHRLRERFRAMVRAVVTDTVESPVEVEGEMRHLLRALERG